MSWVLIVIAGWLALAAVVAPLVWGLGRAASIGDRDQRRQLAGLDVAYGPRLERRSGASDRRAAARPWSHRAPGRRADDLARRELEQARRELHEAEARLAEVEARRSA